MGKIIQNDLETDLVSIHFYEKTHVIKRLWFHVDVRIFLVIKNEF